MSTTWIIIYAVAAIVALSIIYNVVFLRQTIREYEIGLLYKDGRFAGPLTPGKHTLLSAGNEVIVLDGRIQNVSIPGQEVLTSDNIGIKVGLVASYRITDAPLAVNTVDDYKKAFHQSVQLALRTAISEKTLEEVLAARNEISQQMESTVATEAEGLGLALLTLQIRDFIFAGEVKKVFTDILKAQKEGLVLLERARGESAALRSLANSAKMLEQNPGLANLRMLQTIQSAGETSGNTLVIGVPPFANVPYGKDATKEDAP